MWGGGRWAQVSEDGCEGRSMLMTRKHKTKRQAPSRHEDVKRSQPPFSKAKSLPGQTSALGVRHMGQGAQL